MENFIFHQVLWVLPKSFQEMCESSNYLSARTKLSHSGEALRRSGALYRGPGALKCSLFPSTSWEPSPCVSVGVGCVHGILEWGLCAQAWGLGIKEGPLWNHRVASFLRECSGLATCRPLPGAGSVWSSSQGPAMLLLSPCKVTLCREF